MLGTARLGDKTIGVCYAHSTPITVGGAIVSASTDTICNNRGTARLNDTVLADCGHTGKIITASTVTICNNRGTARLGDSTTGDYVAKIISASSDTLTS